MRSRQMPVFRPWANGRGLALLLIILVSGSVARSEVDQPVNAATKNPPNPSSPAIASSPASRPASLDIQLTPWTAEILKLAQARVDENVLLSFIELTPGTFNLGADQIIYLSDLGFSGQTISAMLCHDYEIGSGLKPLPPPTASTPSLKLEFVSAAGNSSATATLKPEPAEGDILESAPALSDSDQPVDPESASDLPLSQPTDVEPEQRELYPVRKPYPVQLASPIQVIQSWGKTPNLVFIEFRR